MSNYLIYYYILYVCTDDVLCRPADGSDHRSCCSQRGVPSACLDWCRQEPVDDNRLCLLQWAPAIFACFEEGRGEAGDVEEDRDLGGTERMAGMRRGT